MENEQRAHNALMRKAIGLLARREHSALELRQKLATGADHLDALDPVVEQLQAQGYQSDTRFAEMTVRSRMGRGQGPMRIRQALQQHGLDDELVSQVMQVADDDWIALAREVRHKRFGPWHGGEYRERAKQMRFLAGRGFTQSHIEAAFAG